MPKILIFIIRTLFTTKHCLFSISRISYRITVVLLMCSRISFEILSSLVIVWFFLQRLFVITFKRLSYNLQQCLSMLIVFIFPLFALFMSFVLLLFLFSWACEFNRVLSMNSTLGSISKAIRSRPIQRFVNLFSFLFFSFSPSSFDFNIIANYIYYNAISTIYIHFCGANHQFIPHLSSTFIICAHLSTL